MPRDKMTLAQFKKQFTEIKQRGYVRSTRRGDTGVGHTFETMLGLKEDNIALPDLGDVEVKARRAGSGSPVTLFTLDRSCWKVKQLPAIKKYGTLDENGRLGMYFRMSRAPNGSGLYIDINQQEISVNHVADGTLAAWSLDRLAQRFMKKFPALIVVGALSEFRDDGYEYFHYTRAQVLKGTSPEILGAQIAEGNVLVDLRLHDKGTCARNHGTAFRTDETNLPLLFSHVTDL
ncbi:MAG TPA: MvaI/BcnI family restriction endonuclease [Pyrinomonadaceae bacterium]|nr:MvaI/BcnI family restriction endonuclease [Pyrinomonadaceae bacterium]